MRADFEIGSNQKARDKLAHHIWGISPNLPDALLLVDPKAVVTSAINYDEVYVYRENDLQSIIAANDRLCGYGLDLQFVIKGHVANRDGQLLTELCSQPEVAERLNRLGGQDRTAQEESP